MAHDSRAASIYGISFRGAAEGSSFCFFPTISIDISHGTRVVVFIIITERGRRRKEMSHHSLRELASSACVGSSSFPASTSYSSSSPFGLFIPSAKENSGATTTTTTGAAAVAAAGKTTIGVSPAIKAVSGSFGGIIEVGLVVLSSSRGELLFVNDDTISKMEKKRRRVNYFCSVSVSRLRRIFTHYSLYFFLSFINTCFYKTGVLSSTRGRGKNAFTTR